MTDEDPTVVLTVNGRELDLCLDCSARLRAAVPAPDPEIVAAYHERPVAVDIAYRHLDLLYDQLAGDLAEIEHVAALMVAAAGAAKANQQSTVH